MRITYPVAVVFLAAEVASAAEPVDFRTDIYPILHDHCFRCHQGADAKSGVRLDIRTEVLARVKVGHGGESLLVKLTGGDDPDRVMPPRGGRRLTAKQVALLSEWIDQGVKWDDQLLPPDGKRAGHWAFRAVKRPEVPKRSEWARNPIDAFVAARHRAQGLASAPEADRRTLLRRLSLDLTGLPPAAEEIDSFLADTRPDAYERRVDQLLASPAYGERWGRHWLDIARYADSEGYENDYVRPYAWRYRDYVIRSFNDDKPFDRFVLEQLAGDELTPYSDEHLIATGFLAAARLSSNEEDKARQLNDMYVDIANATGSAFLGLTFNCAQCHAHKFDPITHHDYYRFQGFFLKGMPYGLALRDTTGIKAYEDARPPEYEEVRLRVRAYLDAARGKLNAAARATLSPNQLAAYDTPPDRRTPEQHGLAVEADLKFQYSMAQLEKAIPAADKPTYADLKKKVVAIERKLPDPPQTWGFYSPAGPHRVHVLPMDGFYPPAFDRLTLTRARAFLLPAGDPRRRGPAVEVGWPAVFGPTAKDAVAERPRTTLAKWLTDPTHPLTARVWVNRIWHYHFGRGIVETGGDFGVRGSPPSHPELLDWLAAELMTPTSRAGGGHGAGGPKNKTGDDPHLSQPWSTKHLQRLIVTSATYRQAARNDAAQKRDPDNRWLTRWKPRRLEAEAVRDAMLAVSGELDRAGGGKPEGDENKNTRRAVYQIQKRQKPSAVQVIFDGPAGATESCPVRTTSETPLAALFLLNNDFPLARAKALAVRVRTGAGDDRAKQIDTAFRLALGRLPTVGQRKAVDDYFRKTEGEADQLILLCHTILCTTEFLALE
ncbi:MAG: Planctomycete cytochrome [Gemmataceae bacterium]|nr:Planctomycete cytochrome [Gemmataceae bacterium]